VSSESSIASALAEALKEADEAFVRGTQERHEKGQLKYGELTYLDNDTVEMAMEEVLDMANYCRYTYIKLWLLQRAIARVAQHHPATESRGWIPTKEMFGT
jgi:hypothetical protein